MRKKVLILSFLLILALALCACDREESEEVSSAVTSGSQIPDVMSTSDNRYEIALCHTGPVRDAGFTEGAFNGVKLFSVKNGKSYKHYSAGSQGTDEDHIEMVKVAINGGAKVVVCVGFDFNNPISVLAPLYPDVKFIHIDGNANEDLKNVAAVVFRDQECGFFAGYAAVKEGYTKLGFTGGGGGANEAVNRYGYGYIQGAEAAAAELGIRVEMKYSYQYGVTYQPSPELQAMCDAWYEDGTEVIFACGGKIYSSVVSAAAANDCYVIGVDSDMSALSRTIVTSALKKVDQATLYALAKTYDGQWEEIGGKETVLSTADGAIGLPTDTWRMENFSVEEYEEILTKVIDGTIQVDDDFSKIGSTEHVNVKRM